MAGSECSEGSAFSVILSGAFGEDIGGGGEERGGKEERGGEEERGGGIS